MIIFAATFIQPLLGMILFRTHVSVEERTCRSVGIKATHGKVENLKHAALAPEIRRKI